MTVSSGAVRDRAAVESSTFTGIVVVIPTRNRADLAINAIASVRGGGLDGARIVVSDNSTDADEAERLQAYCRDAGDDALHYIRPPSPLPMTDHWEWAMRAVLRAHDESHVVYLTDRMLFRRGELARIADFASAYPNDVICYAFDRIVDHATPVWIEQRDWTGKLFRIRSAEVLRQFARGVLDPPGQPKMLNCAVPRTRLVQMRRKYGTVFSSVAPDFSFCFRCLADLDSVLHYDSAAIVHYALARSNGASLSRGIRTKDHADFVANLQGSSMTPEAPIPEIETVGNVIFHEYCRARRETGSAKFPPIDWDGYLAYLAAEIAKVESADVREELAAHLARRGRPVQTAPPRASLGSRLWRLRRAFIPWVVARRIGSALTAAVTRPSTRPVWTFLADRAGVPLPRRAEFRFGTHEEAIAFALRYRSRRARRAAHLHLPGLHPHELP